MKPLAVVLGTAFVLQACTAPAPSITSFSPGAIGAGRSAELTITTQNFAPLFDLDRGQYSEGTATVSLGNTTVTARRTGPERFEVTVPSLTAGGYPVVLSLSDGRRATSEDVLQVLATSSELSLCGYAGLSCCGGMRCNVWAECGTAGRCVSCGKKNQPGCTQEPHCNGDHRVSSETGLCE